MFKKYRILDLKIYITIKKNIHVLVSHGHRFGMFVVVQSHQMLNRS